MSFANEAMKQRAFHVVARTCDIAPGDVLHVEAAGREIAIYNLDGDFFATDDRCTHMRARLSDGYVEGGIVECPLHFGKFDIRNGRALSAPCTIDVRIYPVSVAGDSIAVCVASDDAAGAGNPAALV